MTFASVTGLCESERCLTSWSPREGGRGGGLGVVHRRAQPCSRALLRNSQAHHYHILWALNSGSQSLRTPRSPLSPCHVNGPSRLRLEQLVAPTHSVISRTVRARGQWVVTAQFWSVVYVENATGWSELHFIWSQQGSAFLVLWATFAWMRGILEQWWSMTNLQHLSRVFEDLYFSWVLFCWELCYICNINISTLLQFSKCQGQNWNKNYMTIWQ